MPKLHRLTYLFLLFGLLLCTQSLFAQDLLKGKDLSQIKVELLSEGDIAKLQAQLNSSGMSIDQAAQLAATKGMPAAEIAKLKQRLQSPAGPVTKDFSKTNESAGVKQIGDEGAKVETTKIANDPKIFGAELFTTASLTFEPNLKIATPLNYVLGPDDQLLVNVYGVQEYTGDLIVNVDGKINIPNVGPVKVGGLTIESATERIKTTMGNSVYGFLKTGGSKLSVSLSRIRSIKVTIIGSNRSGNYTLSSLSTVFNALYLCGGPSPFGSFREIELIRNNTPVRKIDLYRFLTVGDQSDNIGLKDNDVIRIPAYKTRVALEGEVKRPGIFEMLAGENFTNLISYASGFTDLAYTATVKLTQNTDKERRVKDIEKNAYQLYQPHSGDIFTIAKILDRFENRVTIKGAVFRPDIYELAKGLRIADLIRKADGLKEDAFLGRAQIIRLKDDLTKEILSIDLKKVFAGDPDNNLPLQREDELLITSIFELKGELSVTIQGEIRIPGEYKYVDKLSLKDLILQAGGFTEAAYNKVEIARLIKRKNIIEKNDSSLATVINTEINLESVAFSESPNITLQPFDLITIRKKPGYLIPEKATVLGEVQFPGPYAFANKNEHISDLIEKSGGLTPQAFLEGAFLKRFKTDLEKQRSDQIIKTLNKTVKDSAKANIETANEITRDFDKIPLDLKKIMNAKGSTDDILLKPNDELVIPTFDGQVKVNGSVLLSTQIPYTQNYVFKDYISAAGGYNITAQRNRAFVVYANGKAATIKHTLLFFKSYPKIMPGCEIVVPKKADRKPLSAAELIALSTALASLIILISQLKL